MGYERRLAAYRWGKFNRRERAIWAARFPNEVPRSTARSSGSPSRWPTSIEPAGSIEREGGISLDDDDDDDEHLLPGLPSG